MIFRTVIDVPKPPFLLTHSDKLLSIGSCFSESIGQRFAENKFTISVNPFGQQYNSFSITQALRRLISARLFSETDLIYHDGLYHSWLHHGSFSGVDKGAVQQHINEALLRASNALKQADLLWLTFGTARVFVHRKTNEVVSNCHKMPQRIFQSRLLSPDEMVQDMNELLTQLKIYNPQLRIIATISPIRYFAFGQYENTVSKAHLFTAIYALQQQHPDLLYFPAYELVLDDLRDYRFFADDLLHPNRQAVDYVWQRLCNAFMGQKTIDLLQQIEAISRAAKHRPRNPQIEMHQTFLRSYLQKAENLERQYGIDFSTEKQLLKEHLTA